MPQVAAELFMVPWGHHRYIIDKCSGNADKALFFVRQIIEIYEIHPSLGLEYVTELGRMSFTIALVLGGKVGNICK